MNGTLKDADADEWVYLLSQPTLLPKGCHSVAWPSNGMARRCWGNDVQWTGHRVVRGPGQTPQ